MDGRMDRWMDGWVGGWKIGQYNVKENLKKDDFDYRDVWGVSAITTMTLLENYNTNISNCICSLTSVMWVLLFLSSITYYI